MYFKLIIEKNMSTNVIEVVEWLKKKNLLKDKELGNKILQYKDYNDDYFSTLFKCYTNWYNEDGLILYYDERFFNKYSIDSVTNFLEKAPEIHRNAFKQMITDRKYDLYDIAIWKLDNLLVDTDKLIDKLYKTKYKEYLNVIYFFKNAVPNANEVICKFLIESTDIKLQSVLKTKIKFKNIHSSFEYSLTKNEFKNIKLSNYTLSTPVISLFTRYLNNMDINELLNSIEIPSNKKYQLCEVLPQYWIYTYQNSNDKEKYELLKILKNNDKLKKQIKDNININTLEF